MIKKLVLFGLVFMLVGTVSLADSFNKFSSYYSYSGGFNKSKIGKNGKHWTRYSIYQSAVSGGVWSGIDVAGRGKDYSAGDKNSYALSRFNVDYYHQHIHSHGSSNE